MELTLIWVDGFGFVVECSSHFEVPALIAAFPQILIEFTHIAIEVGQE